jgi:hypothetical protein
MNFLLRLSRNLRVLCVRLSDPAFPEKNHIP